MDNFLPIAEFQNPQATAGLNLCIQLACNTAPEAINEHVAVNSRRELPWLRMEEPHDRVAVIVGGGPSAADFMCSTHMPHGDIFAINGAAKWLVRRCEFIPKYQFIIDAKAETASLVCHEAKNHIFASQCHPDTFAEVMFPTVAHLATEGVEHHLPPERRAKREYVLLGGGHGAGNSAIACAYALGYRTIHCYGFDSSHRDGKGHAYAQPMNDGMPCIETEFGGRKYFGSIPMKAHAEQFMVTGAELERLGCAIHVHGDGLLPAMWRARSADLSEREKYERMWSIPQYREHSPGEHLVGEFLKRCEPDDWIIDIGCGTGRAGLAMAKAGYKTCLADFTGNSRDPEAAQMPFVQWDLTEAIPGGSYFPYGFCADVMEHIPPADVDAVLANIMTTCGEVFFQISTVPDAMGALIGKPLHLSVHDHNWWAGKLGQFGTVLWGENRGIASVFIVRKKEQL